ncbi:MAG: cysteine--tRNA ligase [Opitutales bacterium]
MAEDAPAPALRLYDTLTRETLPLRPADGQRLRCYTCGPTVYGPAHIGNFRTFVLTDVLIRTARVAGLKPYSVRNITDVDDKTIRDSQAAGEDLRRFTDRWTERFHADCERLNLLTPDAEPRATDHIDDQIRLIEALIGRGHAYASDGSVYFDVSSFADYGKLSHMDPAALQTQAETSGGRTNDADEYDREAVADFALWKAHKAEDGPVAWDSPWGRGRPGWHLECSAMSMRYLGESFDLHGGGEDLCFPHHENEIAQSEGATGQPFAAHWFHCVHLLVEGRKMAKSLGNFFTIEDLIDGEGYAPMEVRYLLLSGHYRQQLNFTKGGLQAARSALEKLGKVAGDRKPAPPFNDGWGVFANAWQALCNDLNTPAALGAFFAGLKTADLARPEDAAGLDKLLYALGLESTAPPGEAAPEAPAEVRQLAEERWAAKQAKDFATADRLRAQIVEMGWLVKDGKEAYTLAPKG